MSMDVHANSGANQMPRSHGEPNLPSWIPDFFQNSVRVFAAHSNHHGTRRNRQLCVSLLCLVLKAAPRDSCDLSSPPSVSSKVIFERSRNLLRNSLQAPCTLTSFVRIEAKPILDTVLLLLGSIVCVCGVVVTVTNTAPAR